MNAANLLAAAAHSKRHTAQAARGRWAAASCSAPPRPLDELLESDHILCARLEHTPVSTWNMIVWAGMMTSDLVSMASKVSETSAVKGAHGLGKLEQLCFNLQPLGQSPAMETDGGAPPA